MLSLTIDVIVAVCAVMLVWCLVQANLRKTQKNSQSDPIAMEDYLQKIRLIAGIGVYDTFRISAEDWHIPADRIDQDFSRYLSTQSVPYYVKDFVRKSQKHIDELYRGKGSSFTDKRLLLFYSFLMLFFWSGALFLSLYVLPAILPGDIQSLHGFGPP